MKFRAKGLGMFAAFFMIGSLTETVAGAGIIAAASESTIVREIENSDTEITSAENACTESALTADTGTENLQKENRTVKADEKAVSEENITLQYEICNQTLESGKRLCDLEYPEYATTADGTRVSGKLLWYFPGTGMVLDENLTITGENGESYVFGWRFLPLETYQNYGSVEGKIVVTIGTAKQTENHVQNALIYTGTEHADEAAEQSGNTGANASGQSFGAASVIVVPEGTDLSSLMGSITTGIGALTGTETPETEEVVSGKTEEDPDNMQESLVSGKEDSVNTEEDTAGVNKKAGNTGEMASVQREAGHTGETVSVQEEAGHAGEIVSIQEEAGHTKETSGLQGKTGSMGVDIGEPEKSPEGGTGETDSFENADMVSAKAVDSGTDNTDANIKINALLLMERIQDRASELRIWIIFCVKLLSVLTWF